MTRIATSNLVPSQLPEFVRSDYATFQLFLEAYYEYLDAQGLDFLTLRDLDQTLDSFLTYFKDELASNLPPDTVVDLRSFLPNMKDLYLAKGTPLSYQLLFKLLYGKKVTVDFPGQKMLVASDGRWQQDLSIFVQVNLGTIDMIQGKLVDVVTPTQIVKVLVNRNQNVELEVDRVVQVSADIFEVFIDRNFFGNIAPGNTIQYKTTFSGTVIATTSSVVVAQAGTGFKPGQLFPVKNGNGVKTVFKVVTVNSTGGILTGEFIQYGVGYNTDFAFTINSGNDYFTQVKSPVQLASILIVPGGVNISDLTSGMSESGVINFADYVVDPTGSPNGGPTCDYWDGTYSGATLREFSETPSVQLEYTGTPAILSVKLGALAHYPGYYSANNGFLDDDVYIQDSKYYQAFSYLIKIDERLSTYKSAVRSLLHPAGMALFGEFQVNTNISLSASLQCVIRALSLVLNDSLTTPDDSVISFITSKVLSDSQVSDDSLLIKTISKALSETLSTPDDSVYSLLTGKNLTETLTTPSDSATLNTGKALSESLSTPDDSVYTFSTGKALSDSLTTPSDTTSLTTAKYLTDSTSAETDDGYVALNPYSQGGYFEVHTIIYDNTIDATFGANYSTDPQI